MKLYFDYNMKPNLEKLQPYKRENTNCIILFSDQGIYTATNKTLKKHIIQDNDIEKYDYHDNTYYIDKSIVTYQNVNKIPFNHKSYKKNVIVYSTEPKSNLKLVIELLDNEITDIYFNTNEDINNPLILNDITTLISMLN